MKKLIVILILFILIAGAAFGQFYIDVHYSFGGINTNSAVTPTHSLLSRPGIGVGFNIGVFDILAGFEWILNRQKTVDGPNDGLTQTGQIFSFYGGAAINTASTERITLSFPVLLRFTRSGTTDSRSSSHISSSGKQTSYTNVFGLDAGARVHYNVSGGWGIYAGFQFGIFESRGKSREKSSGSYGTRTSTSSTTVFRLFPGGSIDLGVTYSF